MNNPNPDCADDCRFVYGPSMTTCAYYPPVYDKHGNNTNPDGNSTSGAVDCAVCKKHWSYISAYGKTTFFEFNGPESQP
jgi:hypothetical protein